jgi:hypothetical protein
MSSFSLMHRALPPFEPPDGAYRRRLALAVVGGARPRGDWRSSATARLQGSSSCSPAAFPYQWSVWWGEASRAAASALPSASRIFIIRAEAEERTEWGVASTWVGDPFLPPVFGEKGILQPRGGVLQPCGGRRTAAPWPGCSFLSSTQAMVGWLLSPALRRGQTLTTWVRSVASVVSSSVPGVLAQLALATSSMLPPTARSAREDLSGDLSA